MNCVSKCRLIAEALIATIDDTLTDYSGKKTAFALTMRNSISHFGIIITITACPFLYNLRGTLVDCGYYMLGLMIFGFIVGMFIIMRDTEAANKRKEDMTKCSDMWGIPIGLIAILMAGTMGHGLGVASSSYATKYVEVRTSFSNFIANALVVSLTFSTRPK